MTKTKRGRPQSICKCGDTKASHISGKYYCQRGFLPHGRAAAKNIERCDCRAFQPEDREGKKT